MSFCCQKCCRWDEFPLESRVCVPVWEFSEFSLSVSSPFSLTPDTPTPCSKCPVLRRHRWWAPAVCSDCMFFACMTAHVSCGWCQPQGVSDLQLKAHRFPFGLFIDFTQYQETKSGRSSFCMHSWLSLYPHKILLYYQSFPSLNYQIFPSLN